MTRLGSQLRKFRTAGGIAGFTVTAIVAALVPGAALTNASWNDNEWDHSALGTENCATAANFTTRGAGKLIDGTLAGTNLNAIASLNGELVTNGASGVSATAGSTSLGSDAYSNPLSVSALSSINVSLGNLLQLPLNTPVGAVNQYAQAHTNGSSTGASGVVDNSGALDLGAPAVGTPTFGTVDLQTLLGTLGLGGVATNIADLNLSVGAVGSSAQLNGCNAMWTKDLYSNLVRKYVIAGLTTNITSPLVGNLVSNVNSTTTTLTNTVNGLAGNGGLVTAVTSSLTNGLGPLLTTLGLGTPTVNVTAGVDFSNLTTLLNTPIQDSGHIVTIDLANGTIAVNTAALFDSTNGLNNQAPNTQLLLNTAVINNLKTAITGALNNYVSSVTSAIDTALNAATVNATVAIPVTANGAGLTINAVATNVKLSALEAGTAPIALSVGCTLGPVVCPVPVALVNAALSLAGSAVTTTIAQALGNGIAGVVNPTVTALTSTLNGVTGNIEDLLATTLGGLFGQGSVLSLVVNNQNAPAPGSPTSGHPLPVWASGLPGPSSSPYGTGRYDESAIELTIAGANVSLDLARSSVGSNVVTP